jgi:hypothetical protein
MVDLIILIFWNTVNNELASVLVVAVKNSRMNLGLLKAKEVPLHTMEALGGRGGIAPTHSRPRH